MKHTEHPLWETQVQLEMGMLREGGDRVRDQAAAAQRKRQMSHLKPVRDLMQDWLPQVADGLSEWVKAYRREGQRGNPRLVPIALAPLSKCDPYVASLVALRAILDGISDGMWEVTSLASNIGQEIEHEMQIRLWESQEPKLFHAQRKRLDAQEATETHRRRVNINRFNELLDKGVFGFGWAAWSADLKVRVGAVLIDTIIRTTGWFEVGDAYERQPHRKPKLVLRVKPGLEEWIAGRLDQQEVSSPAWKPTVIPPKRWKGTKRGGYHTDYVRAPRLIRFHAYQIDQKARAEDEYDALDMPEVYDALHFLQETPWRVNQAVLAVVKSVMADNKWVGGSGNSRLGGIPLSEFPRPSRPVGCPPPFEPHIEGCPYAAKEGARAAFLEWSKAHPKEALAYRGQMTDYFRKNATAVSNLRAASRTFRVALEYAGFERFYFPHMLDFRGRMYPIPVGLQPQGQDLARGLLEFAEGKAITKENGGAGWLAINLATHWGYDKVSFDERIAWVEQREEMWRRIAADPLRNTEWSDQADKKHRWQALAAIYDWVAFLDHGFGYVSHAPVAVDGTCNGIQHFAAMMRDEDVGKHVNLTPGEKPRDIYQLVADELMEKLRRIKKQRGKPGAHAKFWMSFANAEGKLPRALTKRQVMVLPYSATREAFFRYTKLWLDETSPPVVSVDADQKTRDKEVKLRYERLSFLTTHLWDTVSEVVKGPTTVMQWLKDCAELAALGNQPIYWKTPSGFVVRHFYGKMLSRQVECKLDGGRHQLVFEQPTKDLDVSSQLLGIAPNFVHSQDAAAMVLCINMAADCGDITAFYAVHDQFGTHAADMWDLAKYLRRAFVHVHQTDVLWEFRERCLAVMRDHLMAEREIDYLEASQIADERLPPLPSRGSLDLSSVLASEYFFA